MDALISDDDKVFPVLLFKKGSGMLRGFQLTENVLEHKGHQFDFLHVILNLKVVACVTVNKK